MMFDLMFSHKINISVSAAGVGQKLVPHLWSTYRNIVPQEARHQDDRKCGGQRYPDSAPWPWHPESLLRHVEDLPDLVRSEAAALHEAVYGGVKGLAVAAEAEQVRPLPLICEVLTAAQRLIIPCHGVTMLMSRCHTGNVTDLA